MPLYKKSRYPNGHLLFGTPKGTRTPDLLIRSQSLYPTELSAHVAFLKRLDTISYIFKKSKYFFQKNQNFFVFLFYAKFRGVAPGIRLIS